MVAVFSSWGLLVPGVVERQDVRMLQARRNHDFLKETVGTERGRQLAAQDLHGNLAPVLEVLSEIDHGHPPAPDLFFDRITVGQRGFQGFEGSVQAGQDRVSVSDRRAQSVG